MGIFDWFSGPKDEREQRIAEGKRQERLDKMEEANFEVVVKQSIRDMKADLRKLVNASADAVANNTRLMRQHEKLETQANDWKDKARKALQGGREDLAKRALVKANEFGKEAATLGPQVDGAKQTAEAIKTKIQRLKDKIREAERTSATLIARKNAAQAQKKVAAALADLGDGDNAFSTLKRLETSVEKDEAMAIAFDALADGGGDDSELEKELLMLGMEGDSGVDDDLAALKAELEG
ncbi:MAG: PspA/IM30 family protein [Planctomycetota bacterium]